MRQRATRLLLLVSMVWVPVRGLGIQGSLEPWEIYASECPPGTRIVRCEDHSYVGIFSEHGRLVPGENHRAFEGPVYQFDGTRHVRSVYRAGVREGRCRAWHLNGTQWAEGAYIRGEMSGMWTVWYEDGVRAAQGPYASGECVPRPADVGPHGLDRPVPRLVHQPKHVVVSRILSFSASESARDGGSAWR